MASGRGEGYSLRSVGRPAGRSAGRDVGRRPVPARLCPACRGDTADPQTLCGACWADTHFLTGKGCAACGRHIPALGSPAANMLCDTCEAHPAA